MNTTDDRRRRVHADGHHRPHADPPPRRHDDADQLARCYPALLAAARAAVATEEDGESEPLWYVRDELAAQDPSGEWDDCEPHHPPRPLTAASW